MCWIPFSIFFCIRKSCQKRGHCPSTKFKHHKKREKTEAEKKKEYYDKYLKNIH